MEQTLYKRVMGVERPELQQRIFGEYEANPILAKAISGEKSLAETYYELNRLYSGIRIILPRMKNEGHNQQVKFLSELISDTEGLQTRGIFFPDNSITCAVYGAAAVYGLMNLAALGLNGIDAFSESTKFQEFMNLTSSPFLGIGAGIVGGAGFLAASYSVRQSSSRKEAEYLDAKIEEFF